MSFLGGAECSTAANPLAQFSKHTHDDRSQFLDRQTGPREDGPATSIRAQGPIGGQDAVRSPSLSLACQLLILPMSQLDDGWLSADHTRLPICCSKLSLGHAGARKRTGISADEPFSVAQRPWQLGSRVQYIPTLQSGRENGVESEARSFQSIDGGMGCLQ